jgi:hypothetical protein
MKTIKINNKHYQECDVVMLFTYKFEINKLILGKQNTKYENKLAVCKQLKADEEPLWKSQHLYILSNDEIKVGDWCIMLDSFENVFSNPQQYTNPEIQHLNKGLRKVIATTDNSLIISYSKSIDKQKFPDKTLPQIPQQFIEYFINEFNKDNVITKVLVEVESSRKFGMWKPEYYPQIPKLNQNNEISILTTKDKRLEIFNREQLIDFGNAVYTEYTKNTTMEKFTDNWIQQNLK